MAARWEQDNRRKRADRRLSAWTAADHSVDLAPMTRYTINVTLVSLLRNRDVPARPQVTLTKNIAGDSDKRPVTPST